LLPQAGINVIRKKKGKIRRRVLVFRKNFLSKGTFKKHYRGKMIALQLNKKNNLPLSP